MAKKRVSSLASWSVADLRAEIKRRQDQELRDLLRQREQTLAEIAELDRQRLSSQGPTGKRVHVLPPNGESLAEALARVFKRKTLSVNKLTELVLQSRYQSMSPNTRVMVNRTLSTYVRVLKRVARGGTRRSKKTERAIDHSIK